MAVMRLLTVSTHLLHHDFFYYYNFTNITLLLTSMFIGQSVASID